MKLKQLFQSDVIPIYVRFYILDSNGNRLAYGTINDKDIWEYQDRDIYAFTYHVEGGFCVVHLTEVKS